ncbi:hypothetical protein CWI38_0236p0040 [Hamiltosporidium tvaerminnensis]|uniref:Uncharacterized protein n=2 Tax=Hamiltosporidium TaxID=1176354 RepID=A0A4Q9L6N1_9MICR|nr:hypothetical protein CWI37_1092p0010 [Hamiltosporidium tvaerminnensis]TBU01499.1 hypothetical protein CWI36_1328p0030 [Hamiltosporidium magnivora]TBU03184.1 hypothetical protein CWI39_1014p0030 [Hamiltosporidium magnivora]TBU18617.1 hypothetical protein CWI38_0236p0040 [Hamiltosporidium tvaerminnensis]
MRHKKGLLTKWLLLISISRFIIIIKEIYDNYNTKPTIENKRTLFIFLSFILGLTRIISIRKITHSYVYLTITLSFLFEGFLYIFERFKESVGVIRVSLEILIALFSFFWMIFLYPYYLVDSNNFIEEKTD